MEGSDGKRTKKV